MPVNLTARDFRALAQPLPDDTQDAPIRPRRLRRREIDLDVCAVCAGTIRDSDSSYHREIYGTWDHYHFACFFKREAQKT